jgi:DNA gyrase inhibitor GyrI
MTIALIVLVIGGVTIVVGCQTSRHHYESAPYKVVRADGKFELRDYPALTIAETTMTRDSKAADNSFMRLFGFITGKNENKQKIAMTTPVFMSGSDSNRVMAFVMPANMKPDQVPKPADGSVVVRELPGGRFAVLQFSGGRNAKNEAQTLDQLKAWMTTQGLGVQSQPMYGYFDPPWTLPFLRRNEVMLQTEPAK